MKRLLVALAAVASFSSSAQTYPSKPLRLVVPWPPGQATDIAGRIVAQKLSEQMGQPVIVDNRAGAGGTIGTDAVAKAAPDGYTILAASSGPVTISPLLQKVPYTVERDLAPVHLVAMSPYLLVTHPSFPAANIQEFINVVRANPGKYSFASSGTGATAHLIAEYFNATAQLKATHVPYKGSSPALTDLIGGQVDYSIETAAATLPHVKGGRLKVYGLSLAQRSQLAPDIPTFEKAANMPGFDAGAWLGVMVPAGTPPAIIARLAAETDKMLKSADVREKFAAGGLELFSGNTEAFAARLRIERERFEGIIKRANIKVEQ
ncbi:MAG: tripartite tricarboxylate transporter substrate binding protein [Burkholderiales bacterium]